MDKLLTQEQKTLIANSLNSLVPPNKTCICNNPEILIWNELVALPFVDKEVGLSGKAYIVVTTQCNNCGRLDFFSAAKFGL